MPYGGNDWLALAPEATLEPEMPICDPHHHFWDFRTDRIPYHRYLLHELAADINSGHNVHSTVFVEARSMYRPDGPEELRTVGEVEFVQGLAAASANGLYGPGRAAAAIIGHANLNLGDRVEPVLEALRAASPNRFRGVRHSCGWDPNPEVENRAPEDQLASDEFRAGARVLARLGLVYENTVFFPKLCSLCLVRWNKKSPFGRICLMGGILKLRRPQGCGNTPGDLERTISTSRTPPQLPYTIASRLAFLSSKQVNEGLGNQRAWPR